MTMDSYRLCQNEKIKLEVSYSTCNFNPCGKIQAFFKRYLSLTISKREVSVTFTVWEILVHTDPKHLGRLRTVLHKDLR